MVGKLIRSIREQTGMTSQELAELANVSQPYISQIENDHRQPSYNTLLAIAQALNTPMDIFLNSDNPSYDFSAPATGCIVKDGTISGYGSTAASSKTIKHGLSLHTLVDYAIAIENARRAHITPAELNDAIEALKKLKRLRERI